MSKVSCIEIQCIKPPKIFIGRDNRAKIGDFGFARKYTVPGTDETDGSSPTSKKPSEHIGTSVYVAHKVDKQISYDYRADLYNLGVMIFEMFYKMLWGMERSETLKQLRKPSLEGLDKFRKNIKMFEKLLIAS